MESQSGLRKIAAIDILNLTDMMSKEQFSFNKGWSQVKNGDIAECRTRLMAALNINTRPAFLNRLKGEVEPKISEVRAIEAIFAEYGITDVWGM